ncbi:MAG: histidine triad nucleotide-binding protein [Myxococcota bacterium]|nr:histidine triad nucleotide-binding protein [Myxococcota bacterium]
MSEENCIFCKIVAGQIPSQKVYEDEHLLAFEDIHPQAPVHVLVIPKTHVPTLDDAAPEHGELLGRMMLVGAEVARVKGVAHTGYRSIVNCRESSGQVVFHLHLHIMGGRAMGKMG